ncbi:gliding motility-associated C-terminal domain-containing protein [Lewinella sp. LCG006]|uniref:gliding motility-associated C-terminal domain-containing protein n=1 Tax=Lewinella sp. LCG006 TaxID=3231911 RepID=UPI003460488D
MFLISNKCAFRKSLLRVSSRTALLFFLCVSMLPSDAQVCNGSLGPIIFVEDFGSGPNPGPELPAGFTTYTFGLGAGGRYYVTNDSGQNGALWHSAPDHTPNDTDGYMLLFDASDDAGVFFQTDLENLCPNTNYVFSCYVANIVVPTACGGNSREPDLRFTLFDSTTGTSLGTITTGSIPVSTTLEWNEYGITFRTGQMQTSMQIVVTNNAPGGCGNDLVIDDFSLRLCNPLTEQVFDLCDLPGGIIEVGSNTYSSAGTYEDLIPLLNSCNDSTVITTLVGENPVLPTINITFCSGDSVSVGGQVYYNSINFTDTLDMSGPCPMLQPYQIVSQEPQNIVNDVFLCFGESLLVGTNTYTAAGTYIDSLTTAAGCDSIVITNIATAGIDVALNVSDLTLELGATIALQATSSLSNDPGFSWAPPEAFSCSDCPNPVFQPLQSGIYTLTGIDQPSGCTDSLAFNVEVLPCTKVFIPNVFSPNQDGVNDHFQVFAKSCYSNIQEIRIFDRWGGLVYETFDQAPNSTTGLWNGKIGGKVAPAGIYVYTMTLEVLDGTTQQRSGEVLVVY